MPYLYHNLCKNVCKSFDWIPGWFKYLLCCKIKIYKNLFKVCVQNENCLCPSNGKQRTSYISMQWNLKSDLLWFFFLATDLLTFHALFIIICPLSREIWGRKYRRIISPPASVVLHLVLKRSRRSCFLFVYSSLRIEGKFVTCPFSSLLVLIICSPGAVVDHSWDWLIFILSIIKVTNVFLSWGVIRGECNVFICHD